LQIALPGRKQTGGEKALKRIGPGAVKEAALREGHPPDTPLAHLLPPHQLAPPCAQPVEQNALILGRLIANIELLARPCVLLIKRNARLDQRKINLV